jgi:cytosine/adenosine deaminase-related metal-dependent hydrolase
LSPATFDFEMAANVKVDGADLDLSGLQSHPGLINAHDHLQFALFPRLGSGPYPNATEWARDVHHPECDPVRRHLLVPKHLRLIWGGLRNLAAGVTTVGHHDTYHPVFDEDFPVRVIKECGWSHSLAFTADVRERFDATPPNAPFLIHLGEGTDACAAEEIFQLHRLGALDRRTVIVHAVGLTREGWDLVRTAGASVIWCPRSNLFTLGKTLSADVLQSGIPIALGTDSSITTEGDLLDELAYAAVAPLPSGLPIDLVTTAAASILRLPPRPADWIAVTKFGAPPELAVIGGVIRLISPHLADALPPSLRPQFHLLKIQTRPPVLVRCNIPQLLEDTRRYLGPGPIYLAGREVSS